ncbi:DNA-directed RNA polymerase sigma-70 factor [Echinicola pacifica]|uniref:DNA-directed RNA polymerase sigma-70 factor n=1 Tax=Echinicola pacifica TaxID=346377 RepID=A0A918Q4R9_9BACT|nr:RNA polymerase sigma-70 factor [Echinicola pacifica]GGZ33033.1 DNA-directed RNA polymerase sigma-70 factor [Echinicola pacifica]
MDTGKSRFIRYNSHSETQLSIEQLFYAYHKKLVYFSVQLQGDQELAEDLVQDVFIHMAEHSELLKKGEDHMRNYLYRAVKNKSLNAMRDLASNAEKTFHLPDRSSEEQSIIHHMIRTEVMATLYEALESLPEGCRTIASLSYLDGKSNQEVADQLGISINTVKTQKQRGLKLLRLKLNPDAFYLIAVLMNC